MSITKASLIDLNGQELILDADADTSITADTDDQIDIKIAGSDVITLTSSAITSSAATTITVADNSAALTLKSTDSDASIGPILDLSRDNSSAADGDVTGTIRFIADDDANNQTTYVQLVSKIVDASDGSEDGSFHIESVAAGTTSQRVDVLRTETVINEGGSGSFDFRIESSSQANLFVVNAGDDDIGIGLANPTFASGNGMHFADNFKAGFGTGNGSRPDFQISGDNNGLAIACGTGADTADVLINTSGQVGIGTDNPTRLLHLKQDDTTTYAGNSAGTNIALHLANTSTGAAGNTIGIGLSSESNAEVYLNCVTSANNNGGDFVIATRYGGRAEKMRVRGAGGITFNGDTGDANALDDYEEGSWTPVYKDENDSAVTNLTDQSGFYVKIGATVYVQGTVRTQGSSSTSGLSGDLRITGLPYAATNATSSGHVSFHTHESSSSYNAPSELPRTSPIQGNQTFIAVHKYSGSGGRTTAFQVSDLNMSGNSNFMFFSGIYRTDS